MSSEHGRDVCFVKESHDFAGDAALSLQVLQCIVDGAWPWRRVHDVMRPRAANLMDVFSDVRKVTEIVVGAGNLGGTALIERAQQILERTPGRCIIIPVEAHGKLANLLDERKRVLALLRAHCFSEETSEQSDVCAQSAVFIHARVLHSRDGTSIYRLPQGARVIPISTNCRASR